MCARRAARGRARRSILPSRAIAPPRIGRARVAAGAADRRAQRAHLLLGDLDRVHAPTRDVEREAADLAERVARPAEHVGMVLGEELRAEVAARLLVREHGEDDAAGRYASLGLRPQERRDHHCHTRLHVERAATPNHAVDDLGRKRRMRPLLAGRGDDVDVAVEEEWRAAVVSGQARDEVRSFGVARVSSLSTPAAASSARTCSMHARSAPGGLVVSKRSRSRSSSTGSGTTLTATL